ncbi:MAG: hypothetical protein H7X95_04780, partial [Deltaproteobacteria bacterium]|nr:hypothetical protein [Deltaproteobacteria bacterium]
MPVLRGQAANPAVGRPGPPPAIPTVVPAAPAVNAPDSDGAPSPAVYPPPSLPLTFDHARHARHGIACVRCHGGAATSVSVKDNLLPA